MTKAEFARRMGIQRQNVNVLFRTNNLEIIARAAEVLGVPLALLVGYVEEPDMEEYQLSDDGVIRSEEVPEGHASLRYLSTLAVLQLDAILPNAVLKESKPIHQGTKNQKGFNRMLIMEYSCPAIGIVRLTVGQKRSDGAKVQYCITAIDVS